MNNLNVFNVDNEQQELYFLLELDGGSQDEFNDPPLLLTSLTITPIHSILNIIIFIITIAITFIFIIIIITLIFIISIIFIASINFRRG